MKTGITKQQNTKTLKQNTETLKQEIEIQQPFFFFRFSV